MREPTRTDIDNPDNLLRVIRDMHSEIRRVGSGLNTAHEVFNSRLEKIKAQIPSSSVIDGKSPAAALVELGVDESATLRSNLSATAAPTVTDDESAGYGRGSEWMVPSVPNLYKCVDPTKGAAVWQLVF